MKQLRITEKTKKVLAFLAENQEKFFTSYDLVKHTGLNYHPVHEVLRKCEKHGFLVGKERKAKKGARRSYRITQLGISKSTQITVKDAQESRYNKILRHSIKEHIDRIKRDRNLTRTDVVALIDDKLPHGERLTAQYFSDVMSGRRNLSMRMCTAIFDAFNLEWSLKAVRKRAKIDGFG